MVYFDTEKTVTLQLMQFHRDSGLECQCFLWVSPRVVCCKCVFRRPKLATYNKGKRKQTLNICFLFHGGMRLWVTYFLLCLRWGGGGDILRGVWPWKFLGAEFHMGHMFKCCQRKQWITLCVQTVTWQVVNFKFYLRICSCGNTFISLKGFFVWELLSQRPPDPDVIAYFWFTFVSVNQPRVTNLTVI